MKLINKINHQCIENDTTIEKIYKNNFLVHFQFSSGSYKVLQRKDQFKKLKNDQVYIFYDSSQILNKIY